MEPRIPESIDASANVLLVHSTHQCPDGCHRLCQSEGETAELRVSYSNDQPDREPSASGGPSKLGLVSVGDVLRATDTDAGPDFTAPLVVDAVKDPTDLSGIGVAVSRFCEHWGETHQLTVCFHSLDAMLRHTSPKTVFQFTHVLTNRLSNVGALSHFHLDPSAHDDKIVTTFGAIFDEVVVDESAQETMPEATDDEVAELLAEWELETSPDWAVSDPDEDATEATDEEIAQLLAE